MLSNLHNLWICLFVLIVSTHQASAQDPCECDGTSAVLLDPPGYCEYMEASGSYEITGCNCTNSAEVMSVNTTTMPAEVSCAPPPTESTPPPDESSGCIDSDDDGICDDVELFAAELRCYNSTMTNSKMKMAKIILYIGGVLSIICIIATIIINIIHKNWGHHRFIHLFEEIFTIVLFICMTFLNFGFTDKPSSCKIIAILNHYFMCLIAAAFVFEAWFANSMVSGSAQKNGSIPAIINYIAPIVIALISALPAYFFEKEYYGKSLMHCFATSTNNMLWGFVIPVWLLIAFASMKAQLGCLGCDLTKETQDKDQCHWAKHSCKMLSPYAFMLFTVWLMILFAGEHQQIFLFILAAILSVIFGVMTFIIHTYCHMNTCKKWGGKPSGSMYYVCAPAKTVEVVKYRDEDPNKKKEEEPPPVEPEPEAEKVEPHQPLEGEPQEQQEQQQQDEPFEQRPMSAAPPEEAPKPRRRNIDDYLKPKSPDNRVHPGKFSDHTEANKLYNWLMDDSSKTNSNDVFFKPQAL